MTAPLAHDVIQSRSHTDAGQKVTEQFVTCTVAGCDNEMVTKVTKTLKPGDVVLNMARRRGWHILNDGRKTRLCPTHNARFKDTPPQEIDMNAADKTLMPLSESLKVGKPDRERLMFLRREAYDRIRVVYLFSGPGYADGFSDQTIAAEIGTTPDIVAAVREMNFGPAGPDPRIAELRAQVASIETRIGQIEDAALAVVEQAEKKAVELRRDMASLLDRINKLEGVL